MISRNEDLLLNPLNAFVPSYDDAARWPNREISPDMAIKNRGTIYLNSLFIIIFHCGYFSVKKEEFP